LEHSSTTAIRRSAGFGLHGIIQQAEIGAPAKSALWLPEMVSLVIIRLCLITVPEYFLTHFITSARITEASHENAPLHHDVS
jgi:hypothetical protein